MADGHGNVILLPGRGGSVNGQLPQPETLRAVAGRLDRLGRRLQQFSPRSTWPPQRWMIASTPFRMVLISGRNGLSELAAVCAADGQAPDRRALELDDARRDAERRLRDIVACLDMLQRADIPAAERMREAEEFVSARAGVLAVLAEIRHLIAQWLLPTMPDAS